MLIPKKDPGGFAVALALRIPSGPVREIARRLQRDMPIFGRGANGSARHALARSLQAAPLMKAKVIVMPKQSILDPQGVAVREAMRHHGMPGVKSVRVGKMLEVEVDGADEAKMHEICRDLLSNPVIEDYKLVLEN
jgi:phosphoribosylformylglycinamidine synthase